MVAAAPAPLEGMPALRIVSPRNEAVVRGPVRVRFELTGFRLAPVPGNHVHLVLDDGPEIGIHDVAEPFDLTAFLRERNVELAPGTHVLRAFLSRHDHESVKRAGAFAASVFHYRRRSVATGFDLAAPLLTYSRPQGCAPERRRLVDFQLANLAGGLGPDGYRVRYDLDDGVLEGELSRWTPHHLEGLPPGEHQLRLWLVDPRGEPVPGPFNFTVRRFAVLDDCADSPASSYEPGPWDDPDAAPGAD